HSLYSDWNHGNAHFLRGTVKELLKRGHDVEVLEPQNGWSLTNLLNDHGAERIEEFNQYYPALKGRFYNPDDAATYKEYLKNADLVIVHEWNDASLIASVGALKNEFGYKLLFHDTHHRAVSDYESMSQYDFSNYDGALVFGEVIKAIYKEKKWIQQAWTWHEAADTDLFQPKNGIEKEGDLVWIGNWGDDERKEELNEFLIRPVKNLGLKAKVYGVRYPKEALQALEEAGIEYGGWLPNYKVPEVFAKYKVTVHVPRGPYVKLLPGIPTIRPFEALACGIPLISAPWNDAENLFSQGDFLRASSGEEMQALLKRVLSDQDMALALAENGRRTILRKHTCSLRADELEAVMAALDFKEEEIYPNQKKTVQL
ncbi:MAG TPA: glycosyltransferase, partial [Flavobacterium sp.]|nr:glycosyltransferase [Flavobacterium sp.]